MGMLREMIEIPEGQSFRVIRWSRTVSEVESLLADGGRVEVPGEGDHWHYHREMELTLFLQGKGERFVGDHIGAFGAGDLVLLGGMLPHYWHAEGETTGWSIQWHFPKYHPFWELPEGRELEGLFARARGGLRIAGRARDRVAGGVDGLARVRGLQRLAKWMELLGELAEAGAEEMEELASGSFVPPADATYQEAMSRVLRHLVERFREPVRLEEVLEIACLSRPTFARQFKRHTGRSLSEFLIELRVQAACRELAETGRGVLEIAMDCGFSQVSFFNRAFRRAMGCSPSEYRGEGKSGDR